jgi:hypothetical protein
MTTRDELIVKFTADVADFNRRLSEVQTKVTTLNTNVSKQTDKIGASFKKMGGYLATYFSVQALASFTNSVINLADRIDTLSNKTGLSAEFLQRLNYSAIDAGVSLDSIANSVSKLQVNLGSGNKNTVGVLQSLGLDAETLQRESPEQAFLQIIKRLEQIQDKNLRLAAGTAIFGRGYKELELLVAEGSAKIEENLNKSVPTAEQVKRLADLKDEWEKFSLGIQQGAIPVLADLLEFLNKVFERIDANKEALATLNKYMPNPLMQGGKVAYDLVIKGDKNPKLPEPYLPTPPDVVVSEKKVADAVSKTGKEAEKTTDKLKQRSEAIKQNTSSLYALQQAEKEIQDLMKGGYLTQTEAADAIKKLNDDYNELSRTLADDLTEAINRPIRSFADFREIALDALQKIAMQAIITGFQLDKMSSPFGGSGGGGITSGLGSLLGSGIRSILGFAEGGEPPLNRPSIIGERGAELFVPKVAGRVIPNDQIGGGGGVHYSISQNLNFALGVQDTVRAEIMRMMPAINRTTQESIVEANRRGGSMSIIMNNRS